MRNIHKSEVREKQREKSQIKFSPLSLLALLFYFFAFCSVFAQDFQTKLELRFTAATALSNAFPTSTLWGLGTHLEARYTLEPLQLNLVLDPGVSFAQKVTADSGLTEAFGLYRVGEFDLSIGLERMPLEVARLTLPLSIEPLSTLGNRQGRWGVRASWNPEGGRVRLALLEDSGKTLPLLSLRREFGDFELETHLLFRNDRLWAGLGGSGTWDALVWYGEVWGLGYPPDWRYVLGLSGALGDGLWTLEGGYTAPSALEPTRHLIAGQITLPQDENTSLSLLSKVFFDSDALRMEAVADYSLAQPDSLLDVILLAQIGPEPFSLQLSLSFRGFPTL